MPEQATYLHLRPGASLPDIEPHRPFRGVLILEAPITSQWQGQVSQWLVRSGCLYLMAWGPDCSSWDDAVDMANLEAFDFGDIPEDRFVITTWHANQPLQEAFYFCKRLAWHPAVDVSRTLLLHVAKCADEARLVASYAAA